MVKRPEKKSKLAEVQNLSSKNSIYEGKKSDAEEDTERRSSLAGLDIETDSDEDSSIGGEQEEKGQDVGDEEVFSFHKDDSAAVGNRDMKRRCLCSRLSHSLSSIII